MSSIYTTLEPLSEQTFQRFRALIYEKTNINMREGKHILVSNRLRKRILALNLSGYDEYYRYLTESDDRDRELPHFVAAVSTNETYFFREMNHFSVLRQSILPRLFAERRTVRIWSAGCSTGEEPYSLQILLREGNGALWKGEAEITATDISGEAIARARRGEYRERSVRLVPEPILKRYFARQGDGVYRVCDELKSGLEFRVHNLLQEPQPGKRFDIVFCRNVMIYFDKATQRRLVDDYFAEVLSSGGYLCIGHAESLTGTTRKFQYLRNLKVPIYQKTLEEPK